ncbi:MAG TPA: nuclear transport factor 2 family protein [Anaerolineales bacterium]|nr:nuclear transport factor 2 family protein [Anaerolineales bacterium]
MNIKVIIFILSVLILTQVLSACTGSILPAAPSTATAMPTPTTDPLQSAKIVQAFWDALEAGDVETAMAYVDDEAVCAGRCYFTGKTAFHYYLLGYVKAGHVTKISDVKNVGSIVTYSWEVYRRGNFLESGDGNEVMHIEDGKIVYWENQHH